MNINLKGTILCVGKKENSGVNGGQKYYSIAVATPEGDAGNISCSEDVFNAVQIMKQYEAIFVYRDGQYKGLRCVGISLDSKDINGNAKK